MEPSERAEIRGVVQDAAVEAGEDITEAEEHDAVAFVEAHLERMGVTVITEDNATPEERRIMDAFNGEGEDHAD